MSKEELSVSIGIPTSNKWVLVTLHPETNESLEYNMQMAHNIFELTESIDDASIVISKANADFGGTQINEYWERISKANPNKYHLFPSLGQMRYLSFMNECFAVLGNSSSGILEAPCLGSWVINIGNRQTGRHICKNVYQVDNNITDIRKAWNAIEGNKEKIIDSYYGDGCTSEKIVKHIEEYLYANRSEIIGGEFDVDLQSLKYSHSGNVCLDGLYKYSSGRSALYHILLDVKKRNNISKILLPDYLYSSVVIAAEKADVEVVFYPLNDKLELEEKHFAKLYEEKCAVLLINYFGLQNLQNKLHMCVLLIRML